MRPLRALAGDVGRPCWRATRAIWRAGWDSNPQPADLESAARPLCFRARVFGAALSSGPGHLTPQSGCLPLRKPVKDGSLHRIAVYQRPVGSGNACRPRCSSRVPPPELPRQRPASTRAVAPSSRPPGRYPLRVAVFRRGWSGGIRQDSNLRHEAGTPLPFRWATDPCTALYRSAPESNRSGKTSFPIRSPGFRGVEPQGSKPACKPAMPRGTVYWRPVTRTASWRTGRAPHARPDSHRDAKVSAFPESAAENRGWPCHRDPGFPEPAGLESRPVWAQRSADVLPRSQSPLRGKALGPA